MDQRRNHKGKVWKPKDKYKWKHKIPKLWDTARAVLRGEFIDVNVHTKKQKHMQIKNLTLQLKKPEKEEQT